MIVVEEVAGTERGIEIDDANAAPFEQAPHVREVVAILRHVDVVVEQRVIRRRQDRHGGDVRRA